jgi:hypothetical protein
MTTRAKQIVRLILVIGATCAVAGPAFARNHDWRTGDYWHQSRRDHWHERRWYGHGGPVHRRDQALPNARLTPGAVNPAVTQADIHSTICARGYTRSIRPPERYTERLKRRQIREYGYRDRKLWHYEEDHLISLELGGSPTSPRNLWPEPHKVAGGWGSYTKDRLENRLNHMVCRGEISLARAQRMIATNWVGAYKRLIAAHPLAHDPADRY